MHKKLREFLEANGLRADASEAEAWELYRQLQAGGISYTGPERADAEPPAPPAPPASPADPEAMAKAIAEALAADRQRAAEIEDVCRHVGMDEQAIRKMIADGHSVDAARKAALDHLKAKNIPFGAGAGQAQIGLEARDKMRAAAIDGMLMRCGRRVDKPADGAREFRAMRLLDIVRESLNVAGVHTRGLDPRELVSRAFSPATTSDFPILLSNLVNKSLLGAYAEAPATWRPLVATSSATDFKAKHAIKLSSAPDLRPLLESGEYETADLKESGESYAITTRGRIIRLTRQMIINDDLSAFDRVAAMFGAAARRWENQTVYGLITANKNMADGKPLFDNGHNNLLAGAALDSDGLSAARLKMRTQKGMQGELLDVQPAFLLIPAAMETNAEILLRSTALPQGTFSSGVVNPWAGKLTPVSDPLLDAASEKAWYVFAAPGQYPVIEVAWLMGDEQPFIDQEVEFTTDALGVKVRHDFGAGIVDFIGAAKNPGV